MTITLGRPSLDRENRPGVVARITTDAGGWHGVYHLPTHGMSAEEVSAERDRIEARHARKAAKLTELSSLIGSTSAGWTITDATLQQRGHGCEVVCRARSGTRVVEYREFFDDPADTPAAVEVALKVSLLARAHSAMIEEGDAHHASVTAALGLA